jgi:ADP-ribose pyrophosphatase YjhB (NUDIX family)
MPRHTRYQGAIVQNGHILLIMHRQNLSGRSYWVIPGGGIEQGESEEECVRREVKEETNLNVRIERLLVDEPGHPDGVYKRRKTYLCRIISGQASPGYEPEPEAAADYSIVEVRWFDLSDDASWGDLLRSDPYTFPQVVNLRKLLGYRS